MSIRAVHAAAVVSGLLLGAADVREHGAASDAARWFTRDWGDSP
ncbi:MULTISPECIES: hypothetical protein [unclassified Streptomyces]